MQKRLHRSRRIADRGRKGSGGDHGPADEECSFSRSSASPEGPGAAEQNQRQREITDAGSGNRVLARDCCMDEQRMTADNVASARMMRRANVSSRIRPEEHPRRNQRRFCDNGSERSSQGRLLAKKHFSGPGYPAGDDLQDKGVVGIKLP